MDKRAFNLETEETSLPAESSVTLEDPSSSKVPPYRALVSVPFATARELQAKDRRRHKRWLTFLKLELLACVLLVILLVLATSKSVADLGLTLSSKIAVVLDALAVAIIPVVFYGPTRQKHRYRSHRYRTNLTSSD